MSGGDIKDESKIIEEILAVATAGAEEQPDPFAEEQPDPFAEELPDMEGRTVCPWRMEPQENMIPDLSSFVEEVDRMYQLHVPKQIKWSSASDVSEDTRPEAGSLEELEEAQQSIDDDLARTDKYSMQMTPMLERVIRLEGQSRSQIDELTEKIAISTVSSSEMSPPIKGLFGVTVTVTESSSFMARKSIDVLNLPWTTTLDFSSCPVISSGSFKAHMETEHESVWRFDLEQFTDQLGVKYLSVFPVLVKAKRYPIRASFQVILHTKDDEPASYSRHWRKTINACVFTKNDPSHGLRKFIPFLKLGPLGKPGCPDPITFTFEMTLYTILPGAGPSSFVTPTSELTVKKPIIKIVQQPPLVPPEGLPVAPDALIKFCGEAFKVNSVRLNYYSPDFRDYYATYEDKLQAHSWEEVADLHSHDAFHDIGLPLFRKLMDFCHHCTMDPPIPKNFKACRKLIQLARDISFEQLDIRMHAAILGKLTVSTFVEICDLFTSGYFSETYYPILYEFMIDHMEDLEDNRMYLERFEDMRPFYENLVMHCERAVQKYLEFVVL